MAELKSISNILTKYQFQMADPLDERLSLDGPGVVVISKEQENRLTGNEVFFSVLEAFGAASMRSTLLSRLKYWRDQKVSLIVLIARLDSVGARAAALKEISQFCPAENH